MKRVPALPSEIRALVKGIGTEVTKSDLDTYGVLLELQSQAETLNTILGAWENQQTEERKLRRSYITFLKWSLGGQAIIVNVSFFLIGFGFMEISEWVAGSFILAVFAELATMSTLVLRYLFPEISASLLENLKEIKRRTPWKG